MNELIDRDEMIEICLASMLEIDIQDLRSLPNKDLEIFYLILGKMIIESQLDRRKSI